MDQIIEEKENAKAIVNYFELYSACLTIIAQDLAAGETFTDMFSQLINDYKEGRINLEYTHQQLLDSLGTHISFINQVGDKEYNTIYNNLKKSYGIGKEEVTSYGNMLINTNDESPAFNKLLAVTPIDELASQLVKLNEEKKSKKF